MTIKHILFIIFYCFFLFTFNNQQVSACAYIPEANRTSITFFNPDIFSDTTYRTCYLDADYYMPDEYSSPEVLYRYNLLEWQRFFNNLPDLKALASVIYDLDAETLQKKVLQAVKSGTKPDKHLIQNSFIQLLYARKDVETLTYLIYAKHCEPHTQHNWGYWEEPVRDTLSMNQLIEEGQRKYEACQSRYLKLRYAFQVVRLAHYLGKYKDCLQLYEQLVTPLDSMPDEMVTESVVKGWVLSLKAGALLHLGQTAESMYQFSVVFTHFADSRNLAIQNFSYGNEAIWQQMMDIGKTPDEKAAMWMLRALQNNALDIAPLQQIYSLSPSSILTDLMLVREVNKIERFLITPYLTDTIAINPIYLNMRDTKLDDNYEQYTFWQKIKDMLTRIWNAIKQLFRKSEKKDWDKQKNNTSKYDYIDEVKRFAEMVAAEHKVRNTDLWNTVAAYMAYLEQNYMQCYSFLDKVSGADKKVQTQANLIYALARLEESGKANAELEGLFAEALKNMRRPEYEYDNYSIFSRVLTQLAKSYLKNNNIPRAVLCLDAGKEISAANAILDFYATETDLDVLLNLVENSRKTAFDTLLLNNSRYSEMFLLDVQGTKLMRKLKFGEALSKFERISSEYWLKDSLQYFNYTNYIYFACNFDEASTTDTCNKAGFAQKVVALEKMAAQNPKAADVYYEQIANGFFATPFWGYNGALWQGTLVSTLNYYFDYMPGVYPLNIPEFAQKLEEAQTQFVNEYGTRKVAISYYDKVLTHTKNPELAARAAYRAGLSEQEPLSTLHEGNYKDLRYLKLLKEKYANTAFYQDILQNCPGIADF